MSGIVEAISNAVKSGLDHDWVNMELASQM